MGVVSRCLRYIVHINEERDLMMTIHPSEPILAYVGASRMTEPPTRLDVLRSLLSSCLEGKLTKIGDVGEMVSYLLLLFAFDERQFAEPDSAQSDPDKGFYSDNFWKRSMRGYNQTHGNRHSHEQTLEVGDGLFNHFANLRNPPTMKTFKDAFRRGASFFLPSQFPRGRSAHTNIHYGLDHTSFCHPSEEPQKWQVQRTGQVPGSSKPTRGS